MLILVRTVLSSLIAAGLIACSAGGHIAVEADNPAPIRGAAPRGGPRGESATRFVEASSYFTDPAEIDAWYELMRRLKDDFDAVCGDTFCEGDYTNYEPLAFRCSVDEETGSIGRCMWILAASNEEIDPATGDVMVEVGTWICEMPVAPETAASDLVEALSAEGERPIHTTLPGTDRTLYDGLVACL